MLNGKKYKGMEATIDDYWKDFIVEANVLEL